MESKLAENNSSVNVIKVNSYKLKLCCKLFGNFYKLIRVFRLFVALKAVIAVFYGKLFPVGRKNVIVTFAVYLLWHLTVGGPFTKETLHSLNWLLI